MSADGSKVGTRPESGQQNLPGYSDEAGPTLLELALDYVDATVACDTDDARILAASQVLTAMVGWPQLMREVLGPR